MRRRTFPPKLSDVEAVLGPAREWAGRCYEIATAFVDRGFVKGVAVYGHWLGDVHHTSIFAGKPLIQHGWVLVNGSSAMIFDPTRWAFEGVDPYLYFGPNGGEYDEGGNGFRAANRGPCPQFDQDAEEFHYFSPSVIASAAWGRVEKLLGSTYLMDIGDDHPPGTITREQLFWLANLPYEDLAPHTWAVYQAIAKLGEQVAVPIDNWRRAEREAKR